ncbi:hypothetical protein NQ318_021224 [Aromia moschata]|uniref:HTH psq-type domain-containing protein n=1 Tax=Aromia moschata TaxID=1265417 RepID=A0AAV8XZY9_9CUCU|nr:hypothetical protein NQ318_021224 [Aromia moschata]
MQLALADINENKLSIRAASRKYGIPYTTLTDHKKTVSPKKKLGRFTNVFSADEERDFVNHLIDMDDRLAYEYAEKNNITHPFKGGSAAEQWYRNFMRRNPDLSLRAPEPTSVARACGFNRVQVKIFFDNL